MTKHRKVLRSYERTHRGGNWREDEEAKIVKEQAQIARLGRKTDRLLQRMDADAEDVDETLLEELDATEHRTTKTRGNARTHRDRLTELKKNET